MNTQATHSTAAAGSTKHARGPWQYSEAADTVYSPEAAHICEMIPKAYASREKLLANARLIASAPELLCMLERLLGEVCMTEAAMNHCAKLTLEQARAAIAKATGQD